MQQIKQPIDQVMKHCALLLHQQLFLELYEDLKKLGGKTND